VDEIDIGSFHLIEHLAGGRAERLDVFAIALRVDRVEGERRLARATRPGEHHQLATRDAQLEVLQVVLARAFDVDVGRNLHGSNPQRCENPRHVKAAGADRGLSLHPTDVPNSW
jgi:hypothetical protein